MFDVLPHSADLTILPHTHHEIVLYALPGELVNGEVGFLGIKVGGQATNTVRFESTSPAILPSDNLELMGNVINKKFLTNGGEELIIEVQYMGDGNITRSMTIGDRPCAEFQFIESEDELAPNQLRYNTIQ